MNIIFFGTPKFASEILKEISKKNNVVAIVTSVDSKKGRGKKIQHTDVKKIGLELNIPVIQPENLKEESFIENLKKINADLFLVVAFRKLPKKVWKIPKKGTINLHTSLLPNYRGAAPINWSLINGDESTGISTFYINDEIDQGDIILQKSISLDTNTTAAQLHQKMILESIILLNDTLSKTKDGLVEKITQNDNNDLKKAPKIKKELLKIDFDKDIYSVHNHIRGLSPFLENRQLLSGVEICPSAWFYLNNKRIKVQKTLITEIKNPNSKIDTDNKSYLHINFKDKALSLEMIQPEGKKPMDIKSFLQGNSIDITDIIS